MTVLDYDPFMERMIELYEGGYGWDRNDPGGPTKYGITCYDLAEFMGEQMTSMAAWAPIVKAMTMQTADAIYANKYATACDFNNLGPGKDCVVFDFGVNSGPATAIRYAQRVVGFTGDDVDGVLGDMTQTAINDYDPDAFIDGLCSARMVFLQSLSIWPTFKGGWTARVTDLQNYCRALAAPKPVALMAEPATYSAKLTRILGAHAKAYQEASA